MDNKNEVLIYRPGGQKNQHIQNRSNTVTNTIKTLKMVLTKKS